MWIKNTTGRNGVSEPKPRRYLSLSPLCIRFYRTSLLCIPSLALTLTQELGRTFAPCQQAMFLLSYVFPSLLATLIRSRQYLRSPARDRSAHEECPVSRPISTPSQFTCVLWINDDCVFFSSFFRIIELPSYLKSRSPSLTLMVGRSSRTAQPRTLAAHLHRQPSPISSHLRFHGLTAPHPHRFPAQPPAPRICRRPHPLYAPQRPPLRSSLPQRLATGTKKHYP